jgi:DNA-binding response OmpR family regulator
MSGEFAGRKVLIIEDDYLIADELREELLGRGAVVIGPVGNLMSALSLLSHEVPDAAIVDVNLEGSFAFPVLEELDRRSVPFLLVTGYNSVSLPENWRSRPRVTKPLAPAALLKRLAEVIGGPAT